MALNVICSILERAPRGKKKHRETDKKLSPHTYLMTTTNATVDVFIQSMGQTQKTNTKQIKRPHKTIENKHGLFT